MAVERDKTAIASLNIAEYKEGKRIGGGICSKPYTDFRLNAGISTTVQFQPYLVFSTFHDDDLCSFFFNFFIYIYIFFSWCPLIWVVLYVLNHRNRTGV